MPLEVDNEFGKAAVASGRLRQDQLEECIEILVALERVGSQQRLWDVVRRKGYMSAADIAALRQRVAPSTARPVAAEAEETAGDLQPPIIHAQGYVLVHLGRGGRAAIHPLPARLITIGRDASCDIVLPEPDVASVHAQLRPADGGHVIEDISRGGSLIVNDQRVKSRPLLPLDLIQLGSALLLFAAEYGDAASPEPTAAAGIQAVPAARLKVFQGPRRGTAFFIADRPLVIGRHDLANVRLDDPFVAEFHAHVAYTPHGFRVVDLKTQSGTRVNGLAVTHQALRNGDNISIGPCTFSFQLLAPAPAQAPQTFRQGPAPSTRKGRPAETAAPPQAEPEWQIPEKIEVEPITDPFMRRGLEPVRGEPRARGDRPFGPGQLRLTCVEGPVEGKKYVLAKKATVIGREQRVDILIEDASVSRRHAEIALGPERVEVRDLGSRNGIFVNGKRVNSSALRPGDALRIGKCLLIVEEVRPRQAPTSKT